ncbi:MAG TPA: hypothetical protein VKR83_10155 [Ktedonobacteraceae bacterium]|nr:hypothetical protein [Ktedonobacteraceae bacterium]
MQYPTYQEAGWPIGSGMVESANKLVVEARLKGAGMHWERQHVNLMLVLRNAVCNHRWQETWHASTAQRQHERARRRQEYRQQRLTAACSKILLLWDRLSAPQRVHPPTPSRSSTRYSWRQPFLRLPPTQEAVRAK